MDKTTKIQAEKVIYQYTHGTKGEGAINVAAIVMTLIGAVMGATTRSIAGVIAGGLVGLGCAALSIRKGRSNLKVLTNTAGQGVECNAAVARTLDAMENRLQHAFSYAVRPQDKQAFAVTAQQIRDDLQALSPLFTIKSAGPNGFGTDSFALIVRREVPEPGVVRYVTLDKALAAMA